MQQLRDGNTSLTALSIDGAGAQRCVCVFLRVCDWRGAGALDDAGAQEVVAAEVGNGTDPTLRGLLLCTRG